MSAFNLCVLLFHLLFFFSQTQIVRNFCACSGCSSESWRSQNMLQDSLKNSQPLPHSNATLASNSVTTELSNGLLPDHWHMPKKFCFSAEAGPQSRPILERVSPVPVRCTWMYACKWTHVHICTHFPPLGFRITDSLDRRHLLSCTVANKRALVLSWAGRGLKKSIETTAAHVWRSHLVPCIHICCVLRS